MLTKDLNSLLTEENLGELLNGALTHLMALYIQQLELLDPRGIHADTKKHKV